MSSTRDHIVSFTSAALSPSPYISGCPTTVAMLAAPAVLRAAAEGISSPSACRALRTLADQIDDLATAITAPSEPCPKDDGTSHCRHTVIGDPCPADAANDAVDQGRHAALGDNAPSLSGGAE